MFSHDVKETNRTVSHHQQSHRFAWWSNHTMVTSKKNVEVWRIIGWLPSQDASDHKDLIVGTRLYFHICMMNGFQKTHFAAKKLSCGLGFRHCIVTRICMPTPGFVGMVAACRPDPPTLLPKTGRDPRLTHAIRYITVQSQGVPGPEP